MHMYVYIYIQFTAVYNMGKIHCKGKHNSLFNTNTVGLLIKYLPQFSCNFVLTSVLLLNATILTCFKKIFIITCPQWP